jgi:tetrahydromethanopterin S-methyltransferase subunit F
VAIPVIVVFVAALIKKLTEMFSERIMNNYSEQKLKEIQGVIKQVVSLVAQTYVDDLKSRGEFDSREQKAALGLAEAKAKALLTKESLVFISRNYKNADAWLKSCIEMEVRNGNKGNA